MDVLVIGLDGVTFDIIHPLIQSGHCPNLARLIAEGTSGNLMSTMPPVSGPAWHAFKTGRNPGGTGVYDFLRYDPQRYRSDLIQIGQVPGLKLWDIIGQHNGRHVGVYNLPTSYPPSEINGFMVSGFPLPDNASDYTYPLELKSELDDLTGGHKIDISYRDYRSHQDFLADANVMLDQRLKVYNYLKDKYDPEVFIFTFTCTDRVQHRMFQYMASLDNEDPDPSAAQLRQLLCEFWQHLDEIQGQILKTCDENTTVIIMSDNGFGPQREIFYVDQWLSQKGYLRFKQNERPPSASSGHLLNGVRGTARSFIEHLPLRKTLRHFAPEALKRAISPSLDFESMLEKIDWSQTQAYSPRHTSLFGNIYVNLQGREEQGAVPQHRYDEVRNELISDLKSLEDDIPDFKIEVFKREELYSGNYVEQAPDLIYVINDFSCVSGSFSREGSVFQTRALNNDYSGTHRPAGIFAVNGPHIISVNLS